VDYSNADNDNDPSTVATSAQALTALNTAAKAALGLSVDPFASAANGLTFGIREAVTDFTGANGAALTTTANSTTWSTPDQLSNATPTFDGASGASNAIKAIDAAIKTVSSQRADLGAIQNRFEHTINNLNTAIENTTASESRIRDTDMASEMTAFTRAQVLTQAGTSMLAQANQSTQSILKLLG
jgi:flagellin